MTEEYEEQEEILIDAEVPDGDIKTLLKYKLFVDGTQPSGYRFAAITNPTEPGIPATIIEVALIKEIMRLRRIIKHLKAKLDVSAS